MPETKKLRIAMPAWEIGRRASGLGAQMGGLGVVVEELPGELVKAAAKQGLALEVETLTPCFAHYDKRRLTRLDLRLPVTLDGHTFEIEAYHHIFPDGQKVVYFWDEWQLSWTNANALYSDDPQVGVRLYAVMAQAMAGYIKQGHFDTVHLHDYHVGLVPFYLDDTLPVHFTIHNASYQGIIPLIGGGYASLNRLNLPGEKLFHKYFDFFDNLNMMKAGILKAHETGGKITTVSGDLAGTWGYAAELREGHAVVLSKATAQKGSPPGEVFVPNRHLELFEKLPVAGITNGVSDQNWPDKMPELKPEVLKKKRPLFKNPLVQAEMLAHSHNFDAKRLSVKAELKRLLHLEIFNAEPAWDPILFTVVGRLVEQKNLGLVADIAERALVYDPGVKFIVLATPGDDPGRASADHFRRLAHIYPSRVYFDDAFNAVLSRLILAGGDFCLVPSRFEPCGLVDYQASLLGNVVIGRATGGLTKVRHCAYLYDWLDISDRPGEANALLDQVKAAIDTYRRNPARHAELIRTAMAVNAAWDTSAQQYVDMYRFGLLVKKWQAERCRLVTEFAATLAQDQAMFDQFFIPGLKEYGDKFDWELKEALLQN